MKIEIRKWVIRALLLCFVSIISILFLMSFPQILYAKRTQVGNYIIYHENDLNQYFYQRLHNVDSVFRGSELYNDQLKLEICLSDGTAYPTLMKMIWGDAFGWGMNTIATVNGNINFQENTIELHGYKWNFEQLLLHELTHCLQFNALGIMESNPLAKHPQWKWEGYAEYVARQGEVQHSLLKNMERIESARMVDPDEWGVFFEDGTVAPRVYYDYWLMVQYALVVKKMSYLELLKMNLKEEELKKEMMMWYDLKVKN
ncbi:hypothetical protein [Flammeovirga sp. EKP202]|uniref:hypothetical protein n=1 Tax=Flammeovirga sp. EKP202 TaxID=2770592 RepID=UPI00165F7F15|nr:hypothetical protein [Flammeovirga sp. EKP202]MBD0400850.1 hypothetical protein [Flammeovirga sp. EKP202]